MGSHRTVVLRNKKRFILNNSHTFSPNWQTPHMTERGTFTVDAKGSKGPSCRPRDPARYSPPMALWQMLDRNRQFGPYRFGSFTFRRISSALFRRRVEHPLFTSFECGLERGPHFVLIWSTPY